MRDVRIQLLLGGAEVGHPKDTTIDGGTRER
jgi:hypothetical protein